MISHDLTEFRICVYVYVFVKDELQNKTKKSKRAYRVQRKGLWSSSRVGTKFDSKLAS